MNEAKIDALPNPWGKVCEVVIEYGNGPNGCTLRYYFETVTLLECEMEDEELRRSDFKVADTVMREMFGQRGYDFIQKLFLHPHIRGLRVGTRTLTVTTESPRDWKKLRQFIKALFRNTYGFDSIYYEQHG